MARRKRSKGSKVATPKRNLVARAGARTSAGPMKDKRKLSRQEQAILDRAEIAKATDTKDAD